MEKKQDLRITKTKINIKNAFINLLKQKDFNTITVQNILDEALINRKTFYSHYMDKYDLAEKLINEFTEEFRLFMFVRSKKYKNTQEFLQQIDEIYQMLYKQKDEILALWNLKTETICFYDEMQKIINLYFTNDLLVSSSKSRSEFQSQLLSSTALNSLKYMLESDKLYTAHEILDEFNSVYQIITTISTSSEKSRQ